MPYPAIDRPPSKRPGECKPWDFFATLLAASVGSEAARDTLGRWIVPASACPSAPLRRRSTRPQPTLEDGATGCGWFDSSQDLLHGLSVVESFSTKRSEAAPEPTVA